MDENKETQKVRDFMDEMIGNINNSKSIKNVNESVENPRSGFNNPESFILQGFLLMAQQSLDPESYTKFEEVYFLLCRARSAVEFSH